MSSREKTGSGSISPTTPRGDFPTAAPASIPAICASSTNTAMRRRVPAAPGRKYIRARAPLLLRSVEQKEFWAGSCAHGAFAIVNEALTADELVQRHAG